MPAPAELTKRIASAAVLAPLGLLALYAGGALWNAVIAFAVGCVAYEWAGMGRRALAPRLSLIAVCVLSTMLGSAGRPGPALAVLAAGMAILLAWPRAGAAISYGAAYCALPGLALVWLRAQHGGAAIVLLIMLTVWSSDTGAYVAGRIFGGPKLAPSISPSKTWSGAVGGLVAACLIGAIFAALMPRQHALLANGVLGIGLLAGVLGIASQLGDLVESAAKRRFGVKDSGRLIPGHGGLLDRVDGLMAAAPAAALLLLA